MKIPFYLVGGAVRDQLLGLRSKDLDFTVEAPSYAAMKAAIQERGGEIFLEQEQYLTIRAKVPGLGAADYVLARKDGSYDKDGRRPDFVEPGTLLDDLARRDFTVNAMALDEAGSLVDPYNGSEDLQRRLLRCVGHTEKRMKEDALRMLRALRFSITKGFELDTELARFMRFEDNVDLLANVSSERVREELFKCFEHDTLGTLKVLEDFFRIRNHVFSRNIKLTPKSYV